MRTRPKIHRAWNRKLAKMQWEVADIPAGNWGFGPDTRYQINWRKAWDWCWKQNAKENLHGS